MAEEINKKRSVNFIVISGRVVIPSKMKKYKKHLISTTRVRFKQNNSNAYAYVDFVGFDEVARIMNLTCQIGNKVLIYSHLANEIYTNKKGEVKAKMIFKVDDLELLGKDLSEEKNTLDETTLKLIDELNPEEYL